MKKVFLLASVAGLVAFTSCKKGDKTDTTIEQTDNTIETTANDMVNDTDEAFESAKAAVTDAPQLQDAELQEWVNKLHDEAVKAKVASKAGDRDALNNATAEITSLAEALNTQTTKAEYSQAKAYYEEVQAELQNN
ncbi:hypothetical protein KRX57_03560 [Weeksellaceae bacterium TAE3-ERU29]|nr:hypothetical protein [Weeksellaceae bacterium TAE3-ERU29]